MQNYSRLFAGGNGDFREVFPDGWRMTEQMRVSQFSHLEVHSFPNPWDSLWAALPASRISLAVSSPCSHFTHLLQSPRWHLPTFLSSGDCRKRRESKIYKPYFLFLSFFFFFFPFSGYAFPPMDFFVCVFQFESRERRALGLPGDFHFLSLCRWNPLQYFPSSILSLPISCPPPHS